MVYIFFSNINSFLRIGEAKEMKLAKTFEEVQNGETKVAEGKTNGHEKAENGVGRNGGEGKTMTDG